MYLRVTLDPEDEFLILTCNGIWDCIVKEEAVHYVRDRIDTKIMIQIETETLDDITSVGPQGTNGISDNNMTVLVVDSLLGRKMVMGVGVVG